VVGGASRPPDTNTTQGGAEMAWNAPVIDETSCGMEVNMYMPADEGTDFE
jgi:coenzyme PQQ precursor peptide PqqA